MEGVRKKGIPRKLLQKKKSTKIHGVRAGDEREGGRKRWEGQGGRRHL